MKIKTFREVVKQPITFFFVVLGLNIVQGIFTPLLNDEPYYWFYAQDLNLGYYDHPPLIAWIISVGQFFVKGEFGVRFIPILMGSLSFLFLFDFIQGESKNKATIWIGFLLVISSLFLNLYSFLAIPDTPMLFFTILFLWQYRRFLKHESILNSIVLGILASLLLYSKYHGILVLMLVLMSNLKLLKSSKFYLIVFTAVCLYFPHFLWQWNHDYVTLKFHLFEKGNVFKSKYVYSYVGEQLALTGPLLFLILAAIYQPINAFQRSLKFVSIGVYLFFLVASFRGMVNSHWTLIAWPGLLVLTYLQFEKLFKYKKIVYAFIAFNLLLMLLMRVIFLFDLVHVPYFSQMQKADANNLVKMTKRKPIVYENEFIDPSLLLFYGIKKVYAINTIEYKRTQYNLERKIEQDIQKKNVVFLSPDSIDKNSYKFEFRKGKYCFVTEIDSFQSYQSTVFIDADIPNLISKEEFVKLPIHVNTSEGVLLDQLKLVFTMKHRTTNRNTTYIRSLNYDTAEQMYFEFKAPSLAGNYKCAFAVVADTSIHFRTINSTIKYIDVK